MDVLKPGFFLREDVKLIARELLGKVLITNWDGIKTSGRIVETEAYEGETDKASHAFKGLTPRTKTMYGKGGTVYVYLCYGIHEMFNVVTNREGIPHAILIRGVEPIDGIDEMLRRTGKKVADASLTRGPGNVGKAFGFHRSQCGLSLDTDPVMIVDDDYELSSSMIGTSARIGVDYAGDHAQWEYRFYIRGNKYVSGKMNK